MERLLLEEYGVSIGHCAEPAVDPNPKEKESIGYHTDADTLREELKELAGYNPPEGEAESDTEPFGV